MQKNYQKLSKIFTEYYTLEKINSALSWDSQVKMPKQGFKVREKQLTLIHHLTDQIICSPEIEELVTNCNTTSLSKNQQRNFELMKNIVIHHNSVPEKLRKEFNAISLKTEFIWGEAKAKNDFALFNKYFETLITLLREICTIKSEKLGLSKYETLLDQYDPGTREEDLNKVFGKLENKLPDLIEKIIAKNPNSQKLQHKNIRPSTQKKLFTRIIKKIGIRDSWCRIDESLHPFCTGYTGDVRITTRYNKEDFSGALMGLIHESGHALYDSHLPKQTLFQPIGQPGGMAIHESQSLFWEMQIARSMPFCEFISPLINKAFKLDLSTQELYNNLNHVEKTYIRVDSDEATYPLHIILRYDIERDLINSKIETKDIPEIWNEKTKQLLHLPAPEVSKGALQDIHWSDGSLGYFPTYTLGAIYASQIANEMKKQIPNWDEQTRNGNFKEILNFLKTNIHQKASSKPAGEIIKEVCANNLDVDCYLNYLETKYLSL